MVGVAAVTVGEVHRVLIINAWLSIFVFNNSVV